ncbi:hypothetical protein ABZY44_06270 [Streptomyces sp. NPDC006544]|uniref:hypothetical protein n=1 Tax=Streptomyces sp. NPDC006544 TaxID=3154583 RepID=UPI0033B05D8C
MTVVTVVAETDGPPVRGGREAAGRRLRLRLRVVRTTARAVSWYARRDPRPVAAASRRNPDMPQTTAGSAS